MTTVPIAERGSKRAGAKPLRVLMVCWRYLPDLGGIETHIREVTRRLAARSDLEVTVLATDRTRSLPREEIIDGISVLRVPSWPRERDYYFAPQIASVVGQRGRWDLLHCQGIHSPVPVMAMLAARRAHIPYVVTFHTGGHSLRHRNAMRSIQWRLIGPLLRGASALIGVSRFEAETLSRQARLGDKPVTVIRNGGTLPPPRTGTIPIPGRIVSSGRLERYKGHHRVIEALPHVVRDVPEAHVVVLGEGPYEPELRELARRLDVVDRVAIRHIPPRDRQSMATALAEASVFAALSDYEAHPVGVMEALDVGVPVAGFEAAGVAELVAEGWVHGIDPESGPSTIAAHLVASMSSRPPIDRASLPTWDACASDLGKVYEAVGGARASRPTAGPGADEETW